MTQAERIRAWRLANPEKKREHDRRLNAKRRRDRLRLKELEAEVLWLRERLDMAELALARSTGRLGGGFGPRRVTA